MKKFLLSGLTILMSTLVWAVAGEEVAGQVSVPAPRLSDVASESSRVSLFSSGGTSTYRYAAKGGLSTSASGDDITLYFDVSDCFAEIKSARIELMSYDVDYPEATEADITYLNGVDLNQWLKGENGDWEKNTIQITNLSILKTPAVTGGTVRNTFYVDVNAHNEGWITCISEAILIIEGITFTVTASDGSDAEGVHVQWTPLSNATFTLWRGEKPREKTKQLGEGVFTTTEFLDTEVSSGKVYYYTVEASFSSGVDTISGTNDGYADSDIAPKLLHLKLPSFWLENKAPLVWVWNDFNNKKYKVTKFEYEILKINRKGSLKKENDEIKPFDVGTENLADGEGFNFTDNDFGKHSVNFSWTYQNSKGEKKTLSETREITIYFNKYDNNNWYNYWPKMGAIAKGLIGDNPKFKLGVGASGVHGSVKPKNIFADPVECDSYPRILSNIKKEKISYMCSITNLAPTASKLVHESNKEVKGIEALAATLAHELEHVRLYQEYYGAEVLIGDLEVNSGFTKLEDIRNDLNKKFENGKPKSEYSSVTNLSKYKNKIDELANNSWKGVVCDLDGDVVLDHTEGGSSLTVGNPDTKEMVKIDSSYATYGDNEYLARKAEENRGKYFDKEKDWAFPGSKCCPEGSGMSKGVWDASGQKKNMLNSLEPEIFAKDILDLTQPVVLSSVSARLMSSSEEEKGEMGGALDVLPSLFEIEESELSLEGDLGDQTLDYATAEGYTVLATSFTIVNEGEALEAAEVTGYLVDTEGNPVAFAQTTCNLPIGNTMVTLEFPGTSLCRIKSDSYRLALLQVIKTSGDLSEIVFSKTQFENDIFSYNNTQFKGAKANFLYNTFSETKSQEALTVEVNGYVAVPGVYRIEARLEGADGDLVSHVGYEQEFTAGEMTASFVFPNEEIYLSRQNGPYDICFVRISQDGVVLDERRMPYQTSTYSYTDFTPEHVCLVIDESSFKRGDDVVGTDGLITNLSFSFDVDYQGEETTQCQGRLSIYGANDTIVAVSQENFSLVKGRNTLDFLVDGYSIQRSGVNGPYYVKDVLLRPQNGAAECFEPKMTPIELNADDFGAYPFVVTDKVVARENNGNYDLIVPIEIDRAHTLTLYAMLVDAKEQCVATATTSKTYSAPCDDELILTFTATDIAASGRRGPYKVRLIQATTDIPNIEMVSIPVPICTPTYEVVNGEVTITGCILPFGILEIPDVIEGCPVTTIAAAAFKGWSNLTSVTIPSSVTTIGYDAFSGVAPTTLTAAYFPNCGMSRDNLKTLIISEGVTSIKSSAFADCSSLTSVTIPSSVTSIRYGAFADCSSLTSVHISDLAAWCGIDFDSAHGNPLYYAKKLYLNGELITDLVIPFGVTSIGNDAFYNCSSLTSVTIPSSVTTIGYSAFYGCSGLTSVTISEGLTSIGDGAFYGCSSLTSVTIPSSVTTIKDSAFSGCLRLTSVTIPEGVTTIGYSTFRGCSGLTSVTIPKGVTSIGNYAFYYCESLTSVTIPESVTSIGEGAFSRCSSLTSVTIPSSVTSIGDTAFSACSSLTSVTIPEGVTTIGASTFYGCSRLTSVTIPSSVTTIGDYAFSDCSSLSSVTIPSSVTSIGEYAFSDCSGLTSVTIPSSVTSIGDSAFRDCSSLTSVTIPESVTEIGNNAFYGVAPTTLTAAYLPGGMSKNNLKTVIVPEGVTSIEESAFRGCSRLTSFVVDSANQYYSAINGLLCSKDGKTLVACPGGLTSVTIPEGVTSIGNDAFRGCSRLVSVTIPSSVTSIGSHAFSGCSGLTSVTIPSSVTSIGNDAFSGCSGLTSVTIPSSVTSIGIQAFVSCSGLTSVTIPSSVTSIGYMAFYNCSSLTSVTIPEGVTSIGDYAFSYCSSLASVTIPESVTSIGDSAFNGVAPETLTAAYFPNCGMSRDNLKTLIIPEGVTSIKSSAFSWCSGLTSVTIPSSVTSIKSSAFSWCSGLTSVTIPEGVTSIGHQAFYQCSSLTSVTIPSSVTSIGDEVFYRCESLTSVHISNLAAWCAIDFGDAQANPLYYAKKLYLNGELITDLVIPFGVTSIGNDAFYNCSSLTSVTIPEGVTSIGDEAFYDCDRLTSVHISNLAAWCAIDFGDAQANPLYYAKKLYLNGELITDLVIPFGVTSIGDYAFRDCLSLTSVTIPSIVTTIGYQAFAYCSSLTSVTIPEGVTSIESAAFYNCSSLTSVTIPSSVTSIGDSAFRDCLSLTSVTIPEGVTSIGHRAFSECSSLTSVTIPEGVTIATSSGVEISNGTWSAIDVSNINCSHGYQSPRIGHSSSTSMSVKVVGPTVFSFKWKVSSKRSSDYLRWYLDGTPKSRISGTDGDWQAVSCSIPEGEHTIQWAYSKDGSGTSGSDCGWVAFNWAAFAGCANITEVTLPCTTTPLAELFPNAYATLERVTLTGESETIAENLFSGCASLQAVEIPHGVTSIKGNAFSGCLSLTSVTIPSSVTSIGSFAFRGCSGLTSVTIPSSVTSIGYQAFSGCSNLYKDTNGVQYESAAKVVLIDVPTSMTGNFVIPNSVRFIHSSAFYDCSGLTSVTIPSSVTTIGYQAFAYCSRLKTVTFEGEPPVVESSAFSSVASGRVGRYPSTKATEWEAVITDGKWNGLTMVCLEENPDEPSNPSTPEPNFFTYEIKDNAVTITGLQGTYPSAISIPATLGGYPVTTIGDSAFYNCSSLTSVAIPSSVTSIGHQAFFGCSSLTSVTIPSSVTSIGYEAFRDCSNLWKDENGVQYESAAKVVLIDVPTSMTGDFVIPNSVRFIHSSAFYGCSSLTSVTIPEGVTSIRYAAFWGCSSLTSVTIPSSVTSIGDFAFYDCSSLTSVHTSNLAAWCAIDFGDAQANPLYYAKKLYLNGELITDLVIPFGVTSIGDYAFSECSSLTSVTIPEGVTSIGDFAFYDCSSLTSVHTSNLAAWCAIDFGDAQANPLYYAKKLYLNGELITDLVIPFGVTSIGDYAFSECSSLTSVTIPEGVTSIGDRAFGWCSGLTSVTIPEGVTSIRDGAFCGCSGLTSVTIPEGVTSIWDFAFKGCSGLTSVTIPSSVTSIGNDAFSGCSGLTSVTIPEGVTSIGDWVFSGCSGLTSVTIPEGVTSIGDWVFNNCSKLPKDENGVQYESAAKVVLIDVLTSLRGEFVIPNSVRFIHSRAFEGCSSLTSVTIPEGVTSIGDYTFKGCSGLTSVTIPEGVTSIGSSAFRECSGLTSVTIPSSVTSIGSYAFYGCSSLTSVTIPSSVTSIGERAFYWCESLTSVTIPEGVTSIRYAAFWGCSSLTSVTIPEGVTSIGDGAFSGCSGLTSVTIPSSVTSIVDSAFYGCSGLTSVTISEGLTSIGDGAFSGCSSLTSVTIPSSVTSIGDSAFYCCKSLTTFVVDSTNQHYSVMNGLLCSKDGKTLVVCPGGLTSVTIPSSVTTIGDYAFARCSSLTSVTIPEGVISIGSSAFYGCSSLTSVTIPSSVTSIGDSAFYGCSGLTSVTIPSSVTFIGDEAFLFCLSLTSVHISDLAAWCKIAFKGSFSNPLYFAKKLYLNGELITNLVIPSSVTSIEHFAFRGCSGLTSVTIPEGVTSIGDEAFYRCESLTSVTIPSSVTTIKDSAFENCSSLTSVDFKGEPPSVGFYAFLYISSSATGSYLPQYASEWEAVITGGKWNGLKMVQKEMATLPEGLPDAIGEWLTDVLEASGITSGSAVLAEGTTVEALGAARLLGITPSVSVSGNIATVAAESTFEVSKVVVAENAVSLAVTITVEAGRFPSEVSLGGAVKLMVCDTLNGEWTEVTPAPSQIMLTRISDTEATLSVTQTLDAYQFFKVLVK